MINSPNMKKSDKLNNELRFRLLDENWTRVQLLKNRGAFWALWSGGSSQQLEKENDLYYSSSFSPKTWNFEGEGMA